MGALSNEEMKAHIISAMAEGRALSEAAHVAEIAAIRRENAEEVAALKSRIVELETKRA